MDIGKALALECCNLINFTYSRYEDKSTCLIPGYELLAELKAKPHSILAKRELFGIVLRRLVDGQLLVAYRGTDSFVDWFSNSDFSQDKTLLGEVHSGFYELYSQMREELIDAVGYEPFIVTGHSLGGALAALTVADFKSNAFAVTFASPRVGSDIFANDNANANHTRIVNSEDMVPTLPLPVSMNAIYSHFGKCLTFTMNKGSVIDNHTMSCYIEGITNSNYLFHDIS